MTQPASEPQSGIVKELWVRGISALALAATTLLLTWSGIWPFTALVCGVGLVVAWEWGHVVRGGGIDTVFIVAAGAILVAIGLTVTGSPQDGLLALCVGSLVSALIDPRNRTDAALGPLYAGLPCVSLVWLRASESYGLEAIVLLLLVVWATDTGAFIAGRSLGGPRLWPQVSPNKTWSGLAGGVIAAGAVAVILAEVVGSRASLWVGGLGMVLAVISQLGDLFESAIKRSRGVKDASRLIPGHGGFMDRVDGLIVAAIAAALFAAVMDPVAPARALLALP